MATTSSRPRAVALDIALLGPAAARFLERHRSARVAAVFERSLYLEAPGDFLCVGYGIGNGPLNAVLDDADGRWISRIDTGLCARIGEDAIEIGNVRISFARSARWQPAPWPAIPAPARLALALSQVGSIAKEAAPEEGLWRLVIQSCDFSAHDAADPMARVARGRIAELKGWLDRRLEQAKRDPILRAGSPGLSGRGPQNERALTQPTGAPPTSLLGLGPGLTPSGDDVLCGVLIALHAVGAHDAAVQLGRAIDNDAPRATTALSACFLAAAVEGTGSESLHRFVAAVAAADIDALPDTMAALGRIGHSSGWDAMAGAALALRAAAEARRPPQSP